MPPMLSYIVRRLLTAVPTLLAVIVLTFIMLQAAPGSPFTGVKTSPQVERQMRERFGLDRPMSEQLARYVGGILRGDFGPSLKRPGRSVGGMMADGLPVSATIGGAALVLGTAFGIVLGAGAAVRRRGALDRGASAIIVGGIALPNFVLAPILLLVLSAWLGVLPSGGLDGPASYVLPITVMAIPLAAAVTRIVRDGMVESLKSKAVLSARARGLPARHIILRYALPPALLPLVSILAPAAAGLITGSFVVEQIFGIPGLGRAFVVGSLERDYTLVTGVIIVYAALVILLNLAADLLYAALDPRVRL